MSDQEIAARERIIGAVLRRLSAERDQPNTHFDDELDYCDDLIAQAARDLVAALD